MFARYLAALALTLALAASLPAAARVPRHGPTRRTVSAPLSAASLYSARALRRARMILQLKLLELREERLERVRKAIERRVPIDQLLKTQCPQMFEKGHIFSRDFSGAGKHGLRRWYAATNSVLPCVGK